MGITIKTVQEFTCDKCHKPYDDYFKGFSLPLGGDGRDVTFYADISINYVVAYAAKQHICNKCAASILRQAADKMEKEQND